MKHWHENVHFFPQVFPSSCGLFFLVFKCVCSYLYQHQNVVAQPLAVKHVLSLMYSGFVLDIYLDCVSDGGKVALVKGTSLLFILSFLHVCVSCTLVCHFLRLLPPLCPPSLLLFSRNTRPRGEGGLLPFGQLREAMFAPSVCPAEQTALLLQCGQSLGPSL